MIHVQNLHTDYKGGSLEGVSFDVTDGEVLALIGPSGGGKTSLLRCLNLLNRPTSGEIWVDGVNLMDPQTDIYQIRHQIGFIFQEQALFSNKMLVENVMMGPMDFLHKSRQEAFDTAKTYLQLVGLGEKLYYYPQELSGGQKQRGEIARALALEPKILVMDSVTASLDPTMTAEVNAVISQLAHNGMTMVIATHDLHFCQNIANRVLYIDGGRIIESGTPKDLFSAPQCASTQEFVRQLRSLEYDIHSAFFDLYELNARIEKFGQGYFLTWHMVRNMELVVEELLMHNLLKHTDQIHLRFSYYEASLTMEIEFIYSGPAFNPFDTEDEDYLSMLVVQQITEDVRHTYDGENRLRFTLKA